MTKFLISLINQFNFNNCRFNMIKLEEFLTADNIRNASLVWIWLEALGACLIILRQILFIRNQKSKPPELRGFPQYTDRHFFTCGIKMHQQLIQDMKIELFMASIWTVTICSDLIPYFWSSFQLADSELDFFPPEIDLEIRRSLSFGVWFALFEMIILEFPEKFFKRDLATSWGFNYQPMRQWFQSRMEETLVMTFHQTLVNFFVAFAIQLSDHHKGDMHTMFRHSILAVGFMAGMFIFQYIAIFIELRETDLIRPLETGPLRDSCDEMCRQVGFRTNNVYVQIVPPETPANAFCTSYFGLYAKIVFISSIIKDFYRDTNGNPVPLPNEDTGLNLRELEGIFGHELGHWVKGHSERKLCWYMFFWAPLSFLMATLLRENKVIYEAFRFPAADLKEEPYPLLPGLFISQHIVLRFLNRAEGLFSNILERNTEEEADAFSTVFGAGRKLQEGLVKLKMTLLGYPQSDPIYTIVYDHHATLADRIALLKKYE